MLKVKKSKIPNAGKGLFTTSPIQKGDIIVEYKGKKMTWKQAEYKDSSYLYFISKNNCICAAKTPEYLARYANDAEGIIRHKQLINNSEFINIRGRAYIKAIEDIKPGSEIFVGYGEDYWNQVRK